MHSFEQTQETKIHTHNEGDIRVRRRIAELISEYMDVDPIRLGENTPFSEISKEFDSLAKLEIQLLIEKHYHCELDSERLGQFSLNLTELASEVYNQLIQLNKVGEVSKEIRNDIETN